MKLAGLLQCYNESSKGNLKRCLTHMSKFCDDIVVLDDASTDDSVQVAREFTKHVITRQKNEWMQYLKAKQEITNYALTLNPDWLIWLDGDEVFDRYGEEYGIRELMKLQGPDGYMMLEYNLWKSLDKYRIDELWFKNWQPRMWKKVEILTFLDAYGHHNMQHPVNLHSIIKSDIKCIHFGFSTEDKINGKYDSYKAVGQKGNQLERIKSEDGLKLKDFDPEWFPRWLNLQQESVFTRNH